MVEAGNHDIAIERWTSVLGIIVRARDRARTIRLRPVRRDRVRHGIDPVRRNYISREGLASASLRRRRIVDGDHLPIGGACIGEVARALPKYGNGLGRGGPGHLLSAFVGEKEMSLVLADRASEGSAELVLAELGACSRKKAPGVEIFIANVLEQA